MYLLLLLIRCSVREDKGNKNMMTSTVNAALEFLDAWLANGRLESQYAKWRDELYADSDSFYHRLWHEQGSAAAILELQKQTTEGRMPELAAARMAIGRG